MTRRTPGPAPGLAPPRASGDPTLSARLVDALKSGAPEGGTGGGLHELTHGFHTWPAGIPPSSAGILVDLLPPGPVGDPFCGGGTVLVEAMIRGRPAVGGDLSPLAIRVARARTCRAEEPLLTRFRSEARRLTAQARKAARHPVPEGTDRALNLLRRWYEPHVLSELQALREGCRQAPEDLRPLLEICFSAIVVKVSFRRSDTHPGRQPHHRPPTTTAVLFHKKAREFARRIAALRQAVPEGTPDPILHRGDARDFAPPEALAGVVTSPPYPGVYDYLPLQHLRNLWFGLPRDDWDREMGARRAFRKAVEPARQAYLEDTRRWLARIRAVLRPGGRVAVVVGDGRAGGRVVGLEDHVIEAAEHAGLVHLASARQPRPDPTGAIRREHIHLFATEAGPGAR